MCRFSLFSALIFAASAVGCAGTGDLDTTGAGSQRLASDGRDDARSDADLSDADRTDVRPTDDLIELRRYGSASPCERSAEDIELDMHVRRRDDGSREIVFSAAGAPASADRAWLVVSTREDFEDALIFGVDPHVDLCWDEPATDAVKADALIDDSADSDALPEEDAAPADADQATDEAQKDEAPVDALPVDTEPACAAPSIEFSYGTDQPAPTDVAKTDSADSADADQPSDVIDDKCVDGDAKKDTDGCNECFCVDGAWACTDMACPSYGTPEVAINYGTGHAFVQMFFLCSGGEATDADADGITDAYSEPSFAASDALEVRISR